ncbi:MAG: hypothetical protein AAF485_06510, partial [Chloroflexota bacterium]
MLKITRLAGVLLLLGGLWVTMLQPTLGQSYTQTGRSVSMAQASSGGGYNLAGTAGQPDANSTPLSGGNYTLSGGTGKCTKTAPVPLAAYFFLLFGAITCSFVVLLLLNVGVT